MKNLYMVMTGGVHWMGGVQYTRNLLHSLSLLPSRKRPNVVLSVGAKTKNTKDSRGDCFSSEFLHYPFVRIINEPRWVSFLHKFMRRKFGVSASKIAGFVTRYFCWDVERCSVAFPVKGHPLPYNIERVLWIPDFQYKVMPDNFPQENRDKRDQLYAEMLESKSLLVVSSQSVANDFAHYFPEHSDVPVRILRFRSFMRDADYAADAVKICESYQLPEKFIYLPNQFFLHKKHDVAFKALAKLKQAGVNISLVSTGSSADFRASDYYQSLMDIIKTEGLEEQIKILGLIPRDEQIQIYRRAAFVLQTSSFEGWSTSIEDAAALGKTLLMSDIGTHKEQAPQYGNYFACDDVNALAEQMKLQWQQSSPGPDLSREADARVHNRQQCVDFADVFMQIMQEAHERYMKKQ